MENRLLKLFLLRAFTCLFYKVPSSPLWLLHFMAMNFLERTWGGVLDLALPLGCDTGQIIYPVILISPSVPGDHAVTCHLG